MSGTCTVHKASKVCRTDNDNHKNVASSDTSTFHVWFISARDKMLRYESSGETSSHLATYVMMHRHERCSVSALIFKLTVLPSQVCGLAGIFRKVWA